MVLFCHISRKKFGKIFIKIKDLIPNVPFLEFTNSKMYEKV
jgi:hypothetical protein